MRNRLALGLLTTIIAVRCTPKGAIPLDTLVVALSAQPATLDPRYATDAMGTRISGLIFNALVRLGPKLEVVSDAAQSWTVRDHTYTFYLRPDLRFHNGRTPTAEDIEFSFQQYLSPTSPFASMLDSIQSVQARQVDSQIVVTITVKNLSERFLKIDLPVIKILPKKETLAAGGDFSRQLIGTGGFRFVRQDAVEIELAGIHAASKHLLFKIIHDDYTRYQKVLKGEIDIAQMEIGPDKVREFQQRPKEFQVFIYPGLSVTYLLINFREPLLRKKAIRQALAQAIHRQEVIRYKMHGMALEATSILTPSLDYFNSTLKNLPFDLGTAQNSIAQEGVKGRELTLKTSSSPQAVDNGKVLAYQMSRSGLKITTQSYEWGTFYSDVKHGNFQLATMRWVGTVDADIYRMAFHSKEARTGRNRGNYLNPELDRLLDQAAASENPTERKRLFMRIQALVHEDLAILPLWYDQQIAIVKKNVAHYSPTLNGDFWPFMEARKDHD